MTRSHQGVFRGLTRGVGAPASGPTTPPGPTPMVLTSVTPNPVALMGQITLTGTGLSAAVQTCFRQIGQTGGPATENGFISQTDTQLVTEAFGWPQIPDGEVWVQSEGFEPDWIMGKSNRLPLAVT